MYSSNIYNASNTSYKAPDGCKSFPVDEKNGLYSNSLLNSIVNDVHLNIIV